MFGWKVSIFPARDTKNQKDLHENLHCHVWYRNWLVIWNIWIIFHFRNMGCHPNPIDELHHFSRWSFLPSGNLT